MIKQLDDLLGLFASQRDHLDTTVTDLARLGRELANGQDELGKLPAGLAKTTKMLADDKDRLLDTISKITDLARTTDDTVLIGHIDEIKTLVGELGPVIATLAADKTNLAGLITTMQDFVAKVPRAIFNGQLLLYPVLKPTVGNTGNYPTPSSAAGIMRSLNQMMGGVTPP
jgi:phospholipid/cholesterol/gamma-HCH transport system substrate-binding protein